MKLRTLWASACLLGLLAGCTTSSSGTGYLPPGSGGDASTVQDTSGGQQTGDNTKNKATISTKDDTGKTGEVKNEQAAKQEDATKQQGAFGATNAGSELTLSIVGADGASSVIVAHVKTDKYPLPGTIPMGAALSDAWVNYVIASPTATGSYESKGQGTLEISSCPTKAGEVVVGTFKDVVVEASGTPVPGSPKSFTLNGTFNLVYFGGAGALTCKAPEPKPDVTSGGDTASTSGDYKKGTTCAFTMCDGNPNEKRNCCKYFPCMNPCMFKCSQEMETCAKACPPGDMGCPFECVGKVSTCMDACFSTCGVDQQCKNAIQAVSQCESEKGGPCEGLKDDAQESCLVDQCCTEYKAAF